MGSRGRILVIEDDPALGKAVCDGLTLRRYQVLLARGGEEGLRLMEQTRPDAVVTNLFMPAVDGFEVLEAVRRRSPELPVIALTEPNGLGTVPVLRMAVALGARQVLAKPFPFSALYQALEQALTRAG